MKLYLEFPDDTFIIYDKVITLYSYKNEGLPELWLRVIQENNSVSDFPMASLTTRCRASLRPFTGDYNNDLFK